MYILITAFSFVYFLLFVVFLFFNRLWITKVAWEKDQIQKKSLKPLLAIILSIS